MTRNSSKDFEWNNVALVFQINWNVTRFLETTWHHWKSSLGDKIDRTQGFWTVSLGFIGIWFWGTSLRYTECANSSFYSDYGLGWSLTTITIKNRFENRRLNARFYDSGPNCRLRVFFTIGAKREIASNSKWKTPSQGHLSPKSHPCDHRSYHPKPQDRLGLGPNKTRSDDMIFRYCKWKWLELANDRRQGSWWLPMLLRTLEWSGLIIPGWIPERVALPP